MSSPILKEIEEIIDEPLDRAIVKALINELRRKLSEYLLIDKAMKRKYGMSFEEFKAKNIVKKKNYSFEVESDYCDWELAIDGIKTIKEKIEKLERLLWRSKTSSKKSRPLRNSTHSEPKYLQELKTPLR